MSTTIELPRVAAPAAARDPAKWILLAILLGTTSILLGAIWDISWHMTIGRDSLWAPPHVLEQLGAALVGGVCGAYVLWLTFRAPTSARGRAVRFWGFYGPLGAWLCIWGALTMIASVPFDNWWHNAYGLDVAILSPPHTVLMVGVLGIEFGAVLFALAAQNRAQGRERMRYGYAYTFAIGVLIVMGSLALYEIAGYPNTWHGSGFYRVTAMLFPFMLAGVTRAAPVRWPATTAAATYMGIMLVTIWVLQLIPAEPRLAPIYNRVDHMVPLAFPLVLIAPAVVLDWLHARLRTRSDWVMAAVMGAGFVLIMLVVHWPFADFMLSPAARNFVFAADRWPFMYPPTGWRHEFWTVDRNADGSWAGVTFAIGLGIAFLFATLSARIGLAWGDFTRRVLR